VTRAAGEGLRARQLLEAGVADGAYPAAVLEVGRERGVSWRHAAGRLAYEPGAPAASEETVFDLASLTKTIVTTTLAMQLVERRALRLSDPVAAWVSAWRGRDRAHVHVRDLLEHCSGLTAWMPFYRDQRGRDDMTEAICSLPLEYAPWTRPVYSDLGFMLLGFILEDAAGTGLDRQFASVAEAFDLHFGARPEWHARTAPTEIDPWRGRLLCGEVHDENAWALGGVAGHAGLFGTAPAVGSFARCVLATYRSDTTLARRETLARFVTRSTVPRSSRAVGWDTMLRTSSCGTRLSPRAVGHTGFTGTSLWIDPERDCYIVLLTNRVHPARDNARLATLRPRLHDAVMDEFG
jgi:serine-type D-Ala-D-Ala carboxypeptidase